jgi:hypothetical protein
VSRVVSGRLNLVAAAPTGIKNAGPIGATMNAVKVRQFQSHVKGLENYTQEDPPEPFPLIKVKGFWTEGKTSDIYNLLRQPIHAVNRMAKRGRRNPLGKWQCAILCAWSEGRNHADRSRRLFQIAIAMDNKATMAASFLIGGAGRYHPRRRRAGRFSMIRAQGARV